MHYTSFPVASWLLLVASQHHKWQVHNQSTTSLQHKPQVHNNLARANIRMSVVSCRFPNSPGKMGLITDEMRVIRGCQASYDFCGWAAKLQSAAGADNPCFCAAFKTGLHRHPVSAAISSSQISKLQQAWEHLWDRVSTAPGNLLEFKNRPGNLLEFNWSSWKFLCKMSKINRIDFQS